MGLGVTTITENSRYPVVAPGALILGHDEDALRPKPALSLPQGLPQVQRSGANSHTRPGREGSRGEAQLNATTLKGPKLHDKMGPHLVAVAQWQST